MSITVYKLVRNDYTDCYTGKVKYSVGSTRTHQNPKETLCQSGIIHACHKPEQTLAWRNDQWPVRLLKATTPKIIAEERDKIGAHELTIVEELPISFAFGPNGQKVADFINRLSNIKWFEPQNERGKVEQLVTKHLQIIERFGAKQGPVKFTNDITVARAAAWATARDAAWDAAGAIARDAARDAAREAARDVARDIAWDVAWDVAWDAARDAARDAVWAIARTVAGAAAEAAGHMVVEDLLAFENPFAPIMEVWKLGYWPIGVVSGEFLVYERI